MITLVIIYEKIEIKLIMWGSLMLTPIIIGGCSYGIEKLYTVKNVRLIYTKWVK